MTTGFRASAAADLRAVVPEDARAHEPDDPTDGRWQESFCVVWHDPVTASGGNHHFSLWRNRGIADVWSWVVVDGAEVAREQEHELPVPDDDLLDVTVGGMRVRTGGDLAEYRLDHTFPGCAVTVDYRAWSPPVELDYTHGGAQLGKRHYETLGAVDVTLRLPAGERRLSGVAFQDHSWGPRDLARNPAGKFLFAVFGDDLMASVYSRLTPDGVSQDGWVLDAGQVRRVRKAAITADVADDGFLPTAGECTLWTDPGRGLRLRGEAQSGAIEGGIGLLAGDGLMVWEHGGRLGGGMLEVKPLRAPLSEHRRVLDLPG